MFKFVVVGGEENNFNEWAPGNIFFNGIGLILNVLRKTLFLFIQKGTCFKFLSSGLEVEKVSDIKLFFYAFFFAENCCRNLL